MSALAFLNLASRARKKKKRGKSQGPCMETVFLEAQQVPEVKGGSYVIYRRRLGRWVGLETIQIWDSFLNAHYCTGLSFSFLA